MSGDESAASCEPETEEFLPSWIRNKRYPDHPEQADKELGEDLEKEDERLHGGFLEDAFSKYIYIDTETGRPYVAMPCMYHDIVVSAFRRALNGQSTQARPVLAETSGGMDLTTGSRKYPDLFIFGQDRTEYGEYNILEERTYRFEPVNPNAIIEVSWTTKIADELRNFAVQMRNCDDELGVINIGYLIKFVPKTKNKYPAKHSPRNRPLIGFDVYRMEAGDEEPEIFLSWRCGEENPADLEIMADQLGAQREGVSIPFQYIVDALTKYGVVFEEPVGEN